MNESQIQADLQSLAARLSNRAPNTKNERTAAEYIKDRLGQYFPAAHIDEFYCPDTLWYLFASYYVEFAVVSVLAIWWPLGALCYGALVFLAYLAEFMGHQVMGRFLTQYETQNVVAPVLATSPKRQIVVMAHYDSGRAGPLSAGQTARAQHAAALAVVACMVVVLITCALDASGLINETFLSYNHVVRWCAAALLVSAAAALAYDELDAEYAVGANDNASGVAALLQLAERIKAAPIETADVYLVATGANNAWMDGARHYLKHNPIDRDTTYFLSLDSVGLGALAYTTAIGMLQMTPVPKDMMAAAAKHAANFKAAPMKLRTARSDALMPLARGCKAMEITAIPEAAPDRDAYFVLDYALIENAAEFAEAIIRDLAKA